MADGRRQRSARTRLRIIDAAGDLFVQHGYVATTMDAVAAGAGVAVQTVYHVFGTKQRLLAAVLDATIAGDSEPVPVIGRDWVRQLGGQPAAAAAVAELVRGGVAIVHRVTPMYEVVHCAASDPEIGALLADNRRHRYDDQHRLVELLAVAGHLDHRCDVETATDIVYGVLNEEVYRLLTVDRGWSRERFERWATTVLARQLLEPG